MNPLSILIIGGALAVILFSISVIYARYFGLKHSPRIKIVKKLSSLFSIAEYSWYHRNEIYLCSATPEWSIEITLNHEYIHWVLLRLEGHNASDMIDNPKVRDFLFDVDS